jgi:uncharacterized spore protein YtfJ
MNINDFNILNKFDGLKKEIEIGKPVKIGERILYPIVEVRELKDPSYEIMSIIPIAIVVVEGKDKYMLALNEKEVSRDLMEIV